MTELATEAPPVSIDRSTAAAYAELCKLRLNTMSALSAVAGYGLVAPTLGLWTAFHVGLGTMLVACGAAAVNQAIEAPFDRQMRRTERRPLPTGQVTPAQATGFGLALGFVGGLELFVGASPLAALLALATMALYLLIYTPLKRRTPHNTLIGALPGAMPVLVGVAAAEAGFPPIGWALFAILFCWQLPHFAAISWMHRADYARAGYRMMSLGDTTGARTFRYALVSGSLLVAASLVPVALRFNSLFYGAVALALGGYFLKQIGRMRPSGGEADRGARLTLIASVIYLPLVMLALVADRWLVKGWLGW